MDNLIPVNYENSERPTVLGRDLHKALEVSTRYNDWFSRMCEYGFNEGLDFYSFLSKTSEGGRPSQEHQLTIEMAKEICMLQRSEKGKQVRQYFIQLEKAWNTPEMVMARALRMAESNMQKLKALNVEMQAQIEADKPKVIFADAVAASQTSILVGEMAKLLRQNGVEIGQNRLFEWLRNNGYLIKSGTQRNMPTQRSMENKWFEIKETTINNPDGSIRISRTPKITGKGQTHIVSKFLTDEEAVY